MIGIDLSRGHSPPGSLAVEAVELLMQPDQTADVLEELLHRPAWQARGACRGIGTDVFFPTDQITLTRARRICTHCAVNAECAEYALGHPSLKGIWAGMSERARARARSQRSGGDAALSLVAESGVRRAEAPPDGNAGRTSA